MKMSNLKDSSIYGLQKIDLEQTKDTGMALTLILLILGLWQNSSFYYGFATAILVLNMTWAPAFKPLAFVWLRFSHLISKVGTAVILTSLFCMIVLPISLIRRLLGKDDMKIKSWKKDNESVFVKRDITFSADDLTNPY